MKRRSLFSLSHFKLLTGKMGYLYPISCMEVLPGDTFQMASSVFLRFSPMVAPVMTPVTVKIHHWYVPLRLVWDESEDFMTGGPDGLSAPVPPYTIISGSTSGRVGHLIDYFGIPVGYQYSAGSGEGLKFSVLPLRAYNLIWNENYRDQNVQDPVIVKTTSGAEQLSDFNLLRSPWDRDFFTTASPSEQKGVAVTVPVYGDPSASIAISGAPGISGSFTANPIQSVSGNGSTLTVTGQVQDGSESGTGDGSGTLSLTKGTLSADFEGALSVGHINLNRFRESMALQRYEEHRMLYGSRYVEYLRYLGIKASDARLQRPEYLGGGRSVVQFSEVLQTAADGDTPVGTMRGHGIGAIRTPRFRRFFEEHGFIITLMSIRPKSIYQQGLSKMWSREIKTDYWQKEFEHLGQQPVKVKEVYAPTATREDGDAVFGYQDIYNEYRSHPSTVCGEFRNLLNYWHLGREFSEQPVLNSDFISSLPSDRIFADQTGHDTIYMMVNNSVQARRLMSRKGTPR